MGKLLVTDLREGDFFSVLVGAGDPRLEHYVVEAGNLRIKASRMQWDALANPYTFSYEILNRLFDARFIGHGRLRWWRKFLPSSISKYFHPYSRPR